jgi:hypothetical protein
MDIIIGSSRAKNLSHQSSLRTETWSTPGAKISDMHQSVDDHIMLNFPLNPLLVESRNFMYVVCGICDVTTKIKNKQEDYQEIVYNKDPLDNISQLKSDLLELRQYIIQNNLIPVLATIMPVDIKKANFFLLDHGKTSALKFSHKYDEMQKNIYHVCDEINNFIHSTNSTNNVHTLSLHSLVFHNTYNGKKYFKPNHLFDGVHADSVLTSKINRILHLTIVNNRKQ